MPDALGPVDYLVLQFPGGAVTDGPVRALGALLEGGTIRIYDLVVVTRAEDGSFLASPDAGVDAVPSAFAEFAGARSGLLDDADLLEAAAVLDPGSIGVIVLYENTWAAPFVAAAREAGGEVVAGARITAQELMDTLDALEALDPTTPVA